MGGLEVLLGKMHDSVSMSMHSASGAVEFPVVSTDTKGPS